MRVNISVPVELRDRMNKHKGVNWSSIAASAFEKFIERKEKGEILGKMDRIIQILEENGK